MFVAASSRCFSDLPFGEACQALTDLEYDKFEIWMSESSQHLKPSEVVGNTERFVALLRDVTRLSPIALCLGEDVPQEVFEGLCKLGKTIKVAQITLPAAEIGTPFNEEIDRLRQRLAASNVAGIRLSLKTETGRLTEDPRTAVEICQAIPGLGLTLDLSHYISGKFANQRYEQVYPYAYHVHLRDSSRTDLQVPVGLGEIDYGKVIAQLKRCDYNRALSVEILPELLKGADRALEMRKMRMLLETLL